MLPARTKYLVVGAGLHGLSTAYHLGKQLAAADSLGRRHRDPREVASGRRRSGIACGVVRNNYFQPAMQEEVTSRPASRSGSPIPRPTPTTPSATWRSALRCRRPTLTEKAIRDLERSRKKAERVYPVRTAAGTELRRHQVDALAGMLAELIAATQRPADENGNGNGHGAGNGAAAEVDADEDADDDFDAGFIEDELALEVTDDDPGAVRRFRCDTQPPGKTIAAAGFVEAARHLGVLILTHRRLLITQFTRDLTTEGYSDRFRTLRARSGGEHRQPDHDPDVRLVRAPRLGARPKRLPPRHLRRGFTPHSERRRAPRFAPSRSRSSSG